MATRLPRCAGWGYIAAALFSSLVGLVVGLAGASDYLAVVTLTATVVFPLAARWERRHVKWV